MCEEDPVMFYSNTGQITTTEHERRSWVRRSTWPLLLVGLVLILSGCGVLSLHPFYTKENVTFDPALVGKWVNKDEQWTFSLRIDTTFAVDLVDTMRKVDHIDTSYTLDHIDLNGKAGKFIAHLFTLDGKRFLDLFPDHDEGPGFNMLYAQHVVPAHTVCLVSGTNASLHLSELDEGWTNKYLKEHPKAINHDHYGENATDQQLILTDTPERLQGFLRAHLKEEGVFAKGEDLTRKE
jgi:hypothetical protein